MCSVSECDNPTLAKGLCRTHYHRMHKTGSLECSVTYVKELDRFGRLTAVRRIPGLRNKWLCKCSCGNEVVVFATNLTRLHSASCGCLARERTTTHGKSQSPEYKTWMNIRTRCNNPETPYWPLYGGRGISVCGRWERSFEAFLSDMGPKPRGHSIDRIDVNGNYEPTNCRWATHKTQCRNKRVQHSVIVDGQSMTLADAVERTGAIYNTVLYRIRRGWSVDDALAGKRGASNG